MSEYPSQYQMGKARRYYSEMTTDRLLGIIGRFQREDRLGRSAAFEETGVNDEVVELQESAPAARLPRGVVKSAIIIDACLHNQDPEPEYTFDNQGLPQPAGFDLGNLDIEQLRVLMEERAIADDPIHGNSKTSGAGNQRNAWFVENGGWGNGITE